MKKGYIWFFAFQSFNQIPYNHGDIVEGDDILNVIQKIYEAGLNVMLCHNKDSGFFNEDSEFDVIIFVDNKKFKQR